MTSEQFNAISKLLNLRAGNAQDAARMVLVFGMAQSQVGAQLGMSRSSVSNACTRVRKGLALAEVATAS